MLMRPWCPKKGVSNPILVFSMLCGGDGNIGCSVGTNFKKYQNRNRNELRVTVPTKSSTASRIMALIDLRKLGLQLAVHRLKLVLQRGELQGIKLPPHRRLQKFGLRGEDLRRGGRVGLGWQRRPRRGGDVLHEQLASFLDRAKRPRDLPRRPWSEDTAKS